MAEYTKGTGTTQLPQGAASAANAAVPPPEQGPDMQQGLPQDIPVEYSPPSDVGGVDKRETENSQLLTGPGDPNFRPNPASRGSGRVPAYVVRNLPLMAAAARDPEAPRFIKALYRATVARLEAEQAERD